MTGTNGKPWARWRTAPRCSLPLLAYVALAGCSDAAGLAPEDLSAQEVTRVVVDTGQDQCFDAQAVIPCPPSGEAFYGQDAQRQGVTPAYTVHDDGTVTDLRTGLMWTRTPDLDGDGRIGAADKLTADEATAHARALAVGGYGDWRVPTIKELYSLMDFRGVDPSGMEDMGSDSWRPFLDTSAFEFAYGDTSAGERSIDAQFASSTRYVGTTMGGQATMFGVNFADGRIKGYPVGASPFHPQGKTFYVLFVRGGTGYGENQFQDNGDGTVTDLATGLMWAGDDSGAGMSWKEALAWAATRNQEAYLGHSDWRLPNAKELQSLVDYTRAPDVTGTAALDPVFGITAMVNEAGQTDYPAFWSSTTHVNLSFAPGEYAAYVCFGRAMGYMAGRWMDVHGAGAQRSDPKSGYADEWPYGHGPQGDAIRIRNFVRLVRDAG